MFRLQPVIRLIVLSLLVLSGAPVEACTVTDEGETQLADAGSLRVVPVTVDGRSARFLLDTGAETTIVSPAGASRLSLSLDTWTSTGLRGIGGVASSANALVGSIGVAGIALTRRHEPIHNVPVLAMTGEIAALGLDGILGNDLLADHDIELLNHAHTLILHHVEGCTGTFIPWASATAPADFARPFLPVISVAVGDQALRALLDTGSQGSLITRRVAGLRGNPAPGAAGATGIGPAVLILEPRDFGPVSVGRLPLASGPLYVASLPEMGFDMLLGMDRLRELHVWLSYATSQVMLAPD